MQQQLKIKDIVAYFKRTMPEQERVAFKKMLDANPALKQQAIDMMHHATLEALEEQGLHVKLKKLREQNPVPNETSARFWQRHWRWLSVVVTALVVTGLVLIFTLNPNKEEAEKADKEPVAGTLSPVDTSNTFRVNTGDSGNQGKLNTHDIDNNKPENTDTPNQFADIEKTVVRLNKQFPKAGLLKLYRKQQWKALQEKLRQLSFNANEETAKDIQRLKAYCTVKDPSMPAAPKQPAQENAPEENKFIEEKNQL